MNDSDAQKFVAHMNRQLECGFAFQTPYYRYKWEKKAIWLDIRSHDGGYSEIHCLIHEGNSADDLLEISQGLLQGFMKLYPNWNRKGFINTREYWNLK